MTVGDPAQLQAEKEELELENTELRMRLRGGWWRRGAVVIAITTILAAVAPVTSAIRAHFEIERDLALQESKQQHEMALDRERQLEQVRNASLDPLRPPAERVRALRFLLANAPDPALKKWAEAEKLALEAELKQPAERPLVQVGGPAPTHEDSAVVEARPSAPKVIREAVRPRPPRAPTPADDMKADRMALKDDPY